MFWLDKSIIWRYFHNRVLYISDNHFTESWLLLKAGLADYGKPDNYVQRQIKTWSRWEIKKTGNPKYFFCNLCLLAIHLC